MTTFNTVTDAHTALVAGLIQPYTTVTVGEINLVDWGFKAGESVIGRVLKAYEGLDKTQYHTWEEAQVWLNTQEDVFAFTDLDTRVVYFGHICFGVDMFVGWTF